MSKPLADMTADEAIAYTVGEVGIPGFSATESTTDWWWAASIGKWCEGRDECSSEHGRDAFFRSAWVWLAKLDDGLVPIWSREPGKWIVYAPDNGDTGGGDDYRRYDSEVVALCAACLLAAGKEVP